MILDLFGLDGKMAVVTGASRGIGAAAALDHMTRMLASDLAPRIRVNAVEPGSIETDALAGVLNEEMRSTMTSMTTLGRIGRVENIPMPLGLPDL